MGVMFIKSLAKCLAQSHSYLSSSTCYMNNKFFEWWWQPRFFFYYRAYLDINELKNILRLDGSTHLNIFFANSSEMELAGVATWPWDKEALIHLGEN